MGGMAGWSLVVPHRDIARAPAERVFGQPHPGLVAHVLSYVAHDQPATGPLPWRATPLTVLTWVIDLETPVRRLPEGGIPESPVLGMRDRPLLVEQAGASRGIAVAMTPLGAHALFGMPLKELANAAIAVTDLLGEDAALLIEELAGAPGWPERFRILDRYLTIRLRCGPELSVPVRNAWNRLMAGPTRIDVLADEIGWSRQHLNVRFREQIGLNPKTVARIARLNRAMALLQGTSASSWPEIAHLAGYADQAHLNRDFRALTGCTPTEVGKAAV